MVNTTTVTKLPPVMFAPTDTPIMLHHAPIGSDGHTGLESLGISIDGKIILEEGIYGDEATASISILPGSRLTWIVEGAAISLFNPNEPREYYICPNCLLVWKKKKDKPKKCPLCQVALSKYPDEQKELDKAMKMMEEITYVDHNVRWLRFSPSRQQKFNDEVSARLTEIMKEKPR